MFSFDGFLGFCKSFCGIERAFRNPCFISKSGWWYSDKFDFKFSKFFNFSGLFSAIVQTLRAKQNGMFRLQWFGWLGVRGRHLWVSVGLWQRSIQIPFSFLFNKISRNGIWSLLYSIVNCIEGLIEFKVSNNSSGLIWLLLRTA